MRTAFIQSLIRHARENERIFLVVGDLGYSVVEPFADEFPDRFLNAGVAEQNMTGIAAGLAAEGYHVFAYSIANFPTLRCLEQIRNDVCHHRLPVTIVAVGAGLAYGNLGFSHHGVQDIAALRCMPHIAIASPADPNETRHCLAWLLRHPGPSYLRLGKAGEAVLYEPPVDAVTTNSMQHAINCKRGTDDVALCATGSVLRVALDAAELLTQSGVVASVYSVPIVAPADSADFVALWRHRCIVSIEEHVLAGGFGALLRELAPDGVRIRSLTVPKDADCPVGSQVYLREAFGLTAENMARVAADLLGISASPLA
jgi:transketolase